MSTAVAVSTHALTHNRTHTVTYVTSKMLLLLKEIIREVGLDPGKLTEELESLERAISTWLRSEYLTQVTLEIFDPGNSSLVSRWDLEVVYGYGSDDSFWVDTQSIRYSIAKAGLVAVECGYRFLIYTKPGRPIVQGWGDADARSTDGFRKYSLGATIGGRGIGTEVAYWRKP
jgi:hypothetical protein